MIKGQHASPGRYWPNFDCCWCAVATSVQGLCRDCRASANRALPRHLGRESRVPPTGPWAGTPSAGAVTRMPSLGAMTRVPLPGGCDSCARAVPASNSGPLVPNIAYAKTLQRGIYKFEVWAEQT